MDQYVVVTFSRYNMQIVTGVRGPFNSLDEARGFARAMMQERALQPWQWIIKPLASPF